NEMQGNSDAALAFFLKPVATLEKDRATLRDERARGTFLEDRIGFYSAPILQLLDRRRFADAFELLERSRSRALADLLASRKLGLERPEEQKLYAESTVLRTQIADALGALFGLMGEPDAAKNAPKISCLQGQIRTLETQYQISIPRLTPK